VFYVLVACVHPTKDAKTDHRILNLKGAKEIYNWLLGNFWNDISHEAL
jgi:hypothetical protein